MTGTVTWPHRKDALDLLNDALHWNHLNPAEWMELDVLVAQASSAADRGRWEAASELVTQMFLMEPRRCPPPPDGVSAPSTTAAAVGELAKKIESNTCSTDPITSIGNR